MLQIFDADDAEWLRRLRVGDDLPAEGGIDLVRIGEKIGTSQEFDARLMAGNGLFEH